MPSPQSSTAVVLDEPGSLSLRSLPLDDPQADDLVVDIDWSGISTGTERLLWTGRMPTFPGMGYPLVPGYESVGRVVDAGASAKSRIGEMVFVPGARCFGDVRGLFGGAASRVVLDGARAPSIPDDLGQDGVLLALAATAYHALNVPDSPLPELIVGHGVLGRLLARMVIAVGGDAPVVWENNVLRAATQDVYPVLHPEYDKRADYTSICDVSGDSRLLDTLIGRLSRGGEIVLAGFYDEPLQFAFPPAFMREARIRVAAEWVRSDLDAVLQLISEGKLSLQNLITHQEPAGRAKGAYGTAFDDPECLKMVLDWRAVS